jgi:hypothetical protein
MIYHNTTRGVGSFLRAIKKIGLAANNGDTLGEAVISVKSNEFRSGQQRKIQLKTTTIKSYYIIIQLSFPAVFQKMKTNNSLEDQ